jgi:transcriptional regulator GlxA family with amidase domain
MADAEAVTVRLRFTHHGLSPINMSYSVRIRLESEAVVTLELVLDVRTSQSTYSIPDHPPHPDSLKQRFERWARGRLAVGFSLDQAAEALGTSKRTLARRMQSEVGKSPLTFFQDLRIERAVHLLRTTEASVDQIAAEVGYAGGVTLRALLRRRLGRGVREIRRSPILPIPGN